MAEKGQTIPARPRLNDHGPSQLLTNQNLQLPLGPSKIYRPILPKRTALKRRDNDAPTRKQRNITRTPTLPGRPCKVAVCTRSNCTLRTHHLYRDSRVQYTPSLPLTESTDHEDTTGKLHHGEARRSRPITKLSIIEGGVDGLPALPLNGLQKPIIRKHFHQFFSCEYGKVTLLLVPPPISSTEKAAAARKKNETLATALSIPAFCLNYVAAAHHQSVFRKDMSCPDANTMLIHSKITLLLKDELSNVDQREFRDLIYIIFTLVMYETANHRNRRAYALPFHRRAIDHLVTYYGGVHNMGEAIPYVYSLDRIISMFTDEPPIYAPKITRTIRRPCKDPYVYGAFFESPASILIHEEVKEYGFDTCRAIDLVERIGWTFGSSNAISNGSVDVHYLYFLKDCVINQFAHLNAEMAGDRDISRCILVATKVVEYVVLQDTYFVTVPMHLADKLYDLISDTTKAAISWIGQTDVLTWILFVLTCMPVPWEKRPWALTRLRSQLGLKYFPELWPFEWREHELKNLRRFVWSDVCLNDSFRQTCNELADSSMTLSRETTE